MDSTFYGTEGDVAMKPGGLKDIRSPINNLEVLNTRVSKTIERASKQVEPKNVFMYVGDFKTPK